MPRKTTTGSGRTKSGTRSPATGSGRIGAIKRDAVDRLIKRFEAEMDQVLPMGINYASDDDIAVAGISAVDGTSGITSRPEFVQQDDERINGRQG